MKAKLILLFIGLCTIFSSCSKDKSPSVILPEFQYGKVTDIEGNEYKTIKIGDQEWMVENLKTHKLNDGTSLNYVESGDIWKDPNNNVPMMCYLDNDELTNRDKYGALYNKYAIWTGKLAPTGWHVPTDADWQKLKDFLIANGYNYDGTNIENKIGKSLAATNGWLFSNNEGTVGTSPEKNNKSGFNIKPSGSRYDGPFGGEGYFAFFWSADQISANGNCWYIAMNSAEFFGPEDVYLHVRGFSVRCIKD